MTLKLHAMTCGWITMSLGAMLAGEHGRIRCPVPCYLIRHPKGTVLFDSGLHLDCQTDPDGHLGAMAKAFEIDFKPGEEIAARLARLDLGTDDITHLVTSHLHFDHVGGNAVIPNAPLVIQRPEWQAGQDPDLAHANGFRKRDFDLGQDLIQVDGEHDMFGDGSVVCLPTYGHTPGHQSLRVRLASGDVVLTGDACYLRRTLAEMRLPKVVHDPDQMTRSLHLLRDLERRGARIFYGHDPEFWADVPQAPAEIL